MISFLYRKLWLSGPALILCATVFFTTMGACVKAASPQIPLFEVVFFRSIVSVVLMALILRLRGIRFRTKSFPLMSGRALAGFFAVSCNFYGLAHLAFGDAVMLLLTFPLFVALLSFFFLGEHPTRQLVALIIVAWLGISLILKPQVQILNFAGLIVLLGAILSAVDIVTIRLLRKSEHPFLITFYFVAGSSLLSLPLMLEQFVWPQTSDWFFLLGAGLAGTFAQIAISQAYGLGDVSRLSPLSYFSVILSFILGLIFWDELPTAISLIGSAVIIVCCIRIARLEKTGPTVDA